MLLAPPALGLGATLTTLYLQFENEAEAALGLPLGVYSYALLPIGYPMGRFGPVRRIALTDVVFEDRWGQPLPRLSLATMRWAAAHLAGQLILALAQVDDMPEQTVWRPFDIADLDDHFGPHPMDPAKHQRRTETATAWGRYRDRHLLYR
jgi:hypothetical protein